MRTSSFGKKASGAAANELTRRDWLRATGAAGLAATIRSSPNVAIGQQPGDRPKRFAGLTVLNPMGRVPVSLIVDDSTCLVNLNRFAMPQFDEAFGGASEDYRRDWQKWPAEIPDVFVQEFADWAVETGVKGKYSIVPYPACVGRIDRLLPGWSARSLDKSLELVRRELLSHWDIHPEMVTHTRVIDLKTGHPYSDVSLKTMENWDWATGKSVDEMTDYLAYALRILKNVDLPCEGVTTPGGFASRARPQLAEATLASVRDVHGAEIPHYFRDLYAEGGQSVMPRVELASDLDGADPRCVVSIVGCTGDWTGGWDCSLPVGTDQFITDDLQSGRMVDVIQRGEPAIMVCHWTGIYFNGEKLGLQILREVVRRITQRFDHLIWMKLSEIARYWAAKELTQTVATDLGFQLRAPFACPQFTVQIAAESGHRPQIKAIGAPVLLREVDSPLRLEPGTWCRQNENWLICWQLAKGITQLERAR